MPKYGTFFKFRGQAWDAMLNAPGDRAAAVREMAKSIGATVEAYYFMSGAYDGLVILDAPDSSTVAAISVAVSSSGAVEHIETHELFPSDQAGPVLEKAKKARAAYRPPGR